MSTRAAIYLRISKDEAGLGLALDRQRDDCERIVRERGWTLTETYTDDSISAYRKNAKRPAYDRMVSDFEAGRFDALVCYDLDRLTRQPRQLEDWIDAAEDTGLLLVTANGEADLSTDNGRLFARIKASVARAEVERKSARQKRANVQQVGTGKPVAGVRPFGWEADRMTVRESEAEWVRYMHRALLDGISLYTIARTLNDAGVTTTRGNKWSNITLRKLLLRPSNAGILVSNGIRQDQSLIAPIVPQDEHYAVVALLEGRRVSVGRKPVNALLSGILTCGVCGAPMTTKNLATKGGRERFYICTSPRVASERHVTILVRLADPHVTMLLFGALKVRLYRGEQGTDPAATPELVALHAEVAEVRRRKTVVQDLALMPGADLAHTQRQLADLNKAEEAISNKLASALISNTEQELVAGLVLNAITDLDAFIDRFATMDYDRKRALIRGLLSPITVNPGKGAQRISVPDEAVTFVAPKP